MQPKTQPRPVMDVTARRPAAPLPRTQATPPAEPLAVHAAPAPDVPEPSTKAPEQSHEASAPQSAPAKTMSSAQSDQMAEPTENTASKRPQSSPKSQATAPVGVIVCTILVMVGLSALAIAIYVSQ